jgi:exodeoxyribonuclease V alpha subunit
VLLELCRPESLQALGSAAVHLQTTYRNDGAIAAIAARLRRREQQGPALLSTLRQELQTLEPEANVRWREGPASRPPAAALERLRRHQQRLASLAQAGDDTALLRELEQLILLSPMQRGPWGVAGLHRSLLGDRLEGPVQRWPEGTPVLNRRNLEELELANGDVGVLVQRGGERLVLFTGGRLLHPARLGAVEPALALTVHKAQGSQYDEVLLLLPPHPRLDARLVYTGLTRARRQAWLYLPEAVGESGPRRPGGAVST